MIETLAELYTDEQFRGLDLEGRETAIRNFARLTGNEEQADGIVADYDRRFRAANGTAAERENLTRAIQSEDRFRAGEITREEHLSSLREIAANKLRQENEQRIKDERFQSAAIRAEQLGVGEGDSFLQETAGFLKNTTEQIFGKTEEDESNAASLKSVRRSREANRPEGQTVEEQQAILQRDFDVAKSAIRQDFDGPAITLPNNRIQLKEDLIFKTKAEVREELSNTDIPKGTQLLFLRDEFDSIQQQRAAQFAEILEGASGRAAEVIRSQNQGELPKSFVENLRKEGESDLDFVNRRLGSQREKAGPIVGTALKSLSKVGATITGLADGVFLAAQGLVDPEGAQENAEEAAQTAAANAILTGEIQGSEEISDIAGQLVNIVPAGAGSSAAGRLAKAFNLSNRGIRAAQTAGLAAGSFASAGSAQFLDSAGSVENGQGLSQAYTDAFKAGGIEAIMSALGSGGGVEAVLRGGVGQKLRQEFGKRVVRLGVNVSEEVVEEGLTEALQFLAVEMQRNPNASADQLAEAIGQGAFIGGILGTGFNVFQQVGEVGNNALENRRTARERIDEAKELKQQGGETGENVNNEPSDSLQAVAQDGGQTDLNQPVESLEEELRASGTETRQQAAVTLQRLLEERERGDSSDADAQQITQLETFLENETESNNTGDTEGAQLPTVAGEPTSNTREGSGDEQEQESATPEGDGRAVRSSEATSNNSTQINNAEETQNENNEAVQAEGQEAVQEVEATDTLFAEDFRPRNEIESEVQVEEVRRNIRNILKGRPLLVLDLGDNELKGLTGSHRQEAAKREGEEIPVVILDANEIADFVQSDSRESESLFVDFEGFQNGREGDQLEELKAAINEGFEIENLSSAVSLLEREVNSELVAREEAAQNAANLENNDDNRAESSTSTESQGRSRQDNGEDQGASEGGRGPSGQESTSAPDSPNQGEPTQDTSGVRETSGETQGNGRTENQVNESTNRSTTDEGAGEAQASQGSEGNPEVASQAQESQSGIQRTSVPPPTDSQLNEQTTSNSDSNGSSPSTDSDGNGGSPVAREGQEGSVELEGEVGQTGQEDGSQLQSNPAQEGQATSSTTPAQAGSEGQVEGALTENQDQGFTRASAFLNKSKEQITAEDLSSLIEQRQDAPKDSSEEIQRELFEDALSSLEGQPEGTTLETRLYSVPFADPQFILDEAKKVYRAGKNLATFTAELVGRVGDRVRPIARRLFDDFVEFAKEKAFSKLEDFLDATGSRSFVVPRSGRGAGPELDSERQSPKQERASRLVQNLEKASDLGDISKEEYQEFAGGVLDYTPETLNAWWAAAIRELRVDADAQSRADGNGGSRNIQDGVARAHQGLLEKARNSPESINEVDVAKAAYVMKRMSLEGNRSAVVDLGSALRPIATDAGRLVKSFHFIQLIGPDGTLRMMTREAATRIRGGKKNSGAHKKKGQQVKGAADRENQSKKDSVKTHEGRVLRMMNRILVDPRKKRSDLSPTGKDSDSVIVNRFLEELSYPKDRLILDLVDSGIEVEAAKLIADTAEGRKIQEEADRNARALKKKLNKEEQKIGQDYVNELRGIFPKEKATSKEASPFKKLADPKLAQEVTEEQLDQYASDRNFTPEMTQQLKDRANEVRQMKERLAADKKSKAQVAAQIKERLKRSGFTDRQVKFYNQIIRDMIDGVTLDESLAKFDEEVVLDPLLEEGIRGILPMIEKAKGSYRVEMEDKLSDLIEFHTGDKFRSGLGDVFQASILSVNSFFRAVGGIGSAFGLHLAATPIYEAVFSAPRGKLDFFETRLAFRGLFNRKSTSAVVTNFNAIWQNLPQDIDDEFFGANDVLRKDFERALRITHNPNSSALDRAKARAIMVYTSSHINFKILSTIDLPVRQSVIDAEALTSQFRVRERELISNGLTAKEARAKAKRETLDAQERLGRKAYEEYRSRATDEFTELNGKDPTTKKEKTSVDVRALELQRQENLTQESLSDATGTVDELAFIGEPVGVFKNIRDGMLALANILPNVIESGTGRNMDSLRKFIVPFSNIGANSIRMAADGVFGIVTAPLSQKIRQKTDAPVQLTDTQVRNAQRRSLANYAAGLTLLALREMFDDEDGSIFIDVHGFGPPTTSDRRKSLLAKGWKSFSVEMKINGGKSQYLQYGVTPLAFSYGLIGSHSDMEKYGAEDERTRGEKMMAMGYHGTALLTDMGGFRNLKPFVGGSDFQNEDNFGEGIVTNGIMRPFISTAVPQSGNVRYLTQIFDPAVYDNRDPNSQLEGVPFVKGLVRGRKAVDANGEVIVRPLGTRVLGALVTGEREQSEIEKHLEENGIFRDGWLRPNSSTRFQSTPLKKAVEKEERELFLDKKGKPRKMTPEEQEKFEIGRRKKEWEAIQKQESKLRELTGDKLDSAISKIKREAKFEQQVEMLSK